MTVNNKSLINFFGYIYILTILFFIAISLHTWNGDDDKYFSEALNNRSLFEFLKFRYETWTGRVVLEAIMVLTINHPLFFKVSITASLLVMSIAMCKLTNPAKTSSTMMTCLALSLILLINNDILMEAAWWVTGSYNYLQPIAIGMASLYIYFYGDRSNKGLTLLSIPLIIFSCFNEQFSALVVIPFLLIVSIYRKDISKYNLIYSLSAFLSTLFSLLAPGNGVRFTKETATWMPDYANLNFIDKITLGFDRLSAHINEQNLLFIIFMGVLTYIFVKDKKITKTNFYCLIVLVVKMALYLLNSRDSYLIKAFNHSAYMDFGNSYNINYFVPYIFTLIVLFSCLSLLVSLCENGKDLINLPLIFIIGIASVVVMGLSPTVYASSFRILFMFDLSVIYIIMYIISNHLKNRSINNVIL